MPHITDGTFQPERYTNSWTPIPGNGNRGGACYDGNGQALYAVRTNEGPLARSFATGPIKCYRTKAAFFRLVQSHDSVEYLSTISDRHYSEPTCVGLTRINGRVYCTLSGRDEGPNGQGGTYGRVFRDDSPAADGSGPWTVLGDLPGGVYSGFGPYYGGNRVGHFDGVAAAGEIVALPSGVWMTSHTFWGRFGGESTSNYGVSTSTDQGVTWTQRFRVGWYMNGGIYSYDWGRGFGQFDGKWYVGGWGNVNGGKVFTSPDGVSWTHIGTLGFGNSAGSTFPVSTPGYIYRTPGGYGGSFPAGASGGWLEGTNAAPESMPVYDDIVYTGAVGASYYIANIGPDDEPVWAPVDHGRVLGPRGTGWVVGRVSLG